MGGVERYILASTSYGVEVKIELRKREKQNVWVKDLGRIGGDDQAYIFNLIKNNSLNNVDHLKVEGERWRIARRSKRQAGRYAPHARNLSGLRYPDAPYAQ